MEETKKQFDENTPGMNGPLAKTLRSMIGYMRKALIFRGILFLLLGLLMIFRPAQTLTVFTIAIGVLILLDGISMLIAALLYHGKGKIILVLDAVFFLLLGIFTCSSPLWMNLVWVVMIGFWQFFSGIHSLSFRSAGGFSAILSGVCGIIAGLFLILMPLAGLLTLMWLMAVITFVSGLAAIVLGCRMKKCLK